MSGTIVAIGDSITYGYPYEPRYSWVNMVAALTGWNMVNKGVCGETTGDMLQRFAWDVVAIKPQYVIITGGSNDAFLGVPPAEVLANVSAMAEQAQAAGITPLIGLPVPSDFPEDEGLLVEYRRQLREFAMANGIGQIDFFQALADEAGGLRAGMHVDGVHPNEAGYRLLAQAAATVLQGLPRL